MTDVILSNSNSVTLSERSEQFLGKGEFSHRARMSTEGLVQRLSKGDHVICAEGYIFEFERRGYLKAGAFVPEVVIEHPDLVRVLHEEFVHAGSDVVEAFTYYGHRAKLRIVKRENELEELNRKALQIARQVATKTGTLMAGNLCNTTIYNPRDEKSLAEVRAIFKEQVIWAREEGADYIIGETFGAYGEAMLALQAIKEYGNGLPAVITICCQPNNVTNDGVPIPEACRKLEENGAAAVGLNCFSGPQSIIPSIREVRAACKGPVACLPVPYRTDEKAKHMVEFKDNITNESSFPLNLDCWLCSREEIAELTRNLLSIGVNYMGLCCGNRAFYTRVMAETMDRHPPASKYSPDMSQHLSQIKSGTYDKEMWHSQFK